MPQAQAGRQLLQKQERARRLGSAVQGLLLKAPRTPTQRISPRLASHMRNVVKACAAGECARTMDLVGVPLWLFMVYLEGRFHKWPGIVWHNMHLWHIDHV